VVVRIWDERRLILPISYFLEKPFTNWTRRTAEILGTVTLHVDYSAPLDAIRAELTRIAENHEDWDGRVCELVVLDASESNIELRALVSAQDSGRAWRLRCAVREGLVGFLQREHPGSLPLVRTRPMGTRGSEADGIAADAGDAGDAGDATT
jgi:small-conductance mechanosensitive channel